MCALYPAHISLSDMTADTFTEVQKSSKEQILFQRDEIEVQESYFESGWHATAF